MSGFYNTLCKPFSGDYPMTSRWGDRLIYGSWQWHTGIDWAMPIGTPLFAIEDGLVIRATAEGQYGGLYIDIQYSTHTVRYLHVSVFAVTVGSRVRQGEIVAYSGNTGLSTGPHLHLEVMRNQNPAFIGINPNTGEFDQRWKDVKDLDMLRDEIIRELTVNKDYYKFPESTRLKLIERAGDAKFILDWAGAKPRRESAPFVRAFERLKKHAIWKRLDKTARDRINKHNIISIHTRWEAEKKRRLENK